MPKPPSGKQSIKTLSMAKTFGGGSNSDKPPNYDSNEIDLSGLAHVG